MTEPVEGASEDPRKTGLKTGLRQLTDDQLVKVLTYQGDFVLDTYNYFDGNFCPLAVALDLPATLAAPTNERVIATLENLGYKVFNTRGIAGVFYTTDRLRDLRIATNEVLAERAAPVVVRPPR